MEPHGAASKAQSGISRLIQKVTQGGVLRTMDVHTAEQRSRNMAAIRGEIRNRNCVCVLPSMLWATVFGCIAKTCRDDPTSFYRAFGRQSLFMGASGTRTL